MKRFRLMTLEFHQAYSLVLLLNQHQFAYSVISIIESNERSDARQLSGSRAAVAVNHFQLEFASYSRSQPFARAKCALSAAMEHWLLSSDASARQISGGIGWIDERIFDLIAGCSRQRNGVCVWHRTEAKLCGIETISSAEGLRCSRTMFTEITLRRYNLVL